MPVAPPRFGFTANRTERQPWPHNGKTTTQRGYGWDHQKARARLLKREPLCRMCKAAGRTTIACIADHIKPLAEGGSRDESNLQPLCKPCSDAKTKAEAGRGRPPY
jgi:5-methylcytosine-specific restriction protein A